MQSSHDLRMTRQRQVIMEELCSITTHPTAEALHQQVRQRLPRISLATVYRNLELLAERGLVQRLNLGGGRRRFDARTERHCHVRCLDCGAVADLQHSPGEIPAAAAAAPGGWQITGHELEFTGYCGDCRRDGSGGAPADRDSGRAE